MMEEFMDIMRGIPLDKRKIILDAFRNGAADTLEHNIEHELLVEKWVEDQGERVLRVNNYDLKENSVVFDVGGYAGDWAAAIYCKYGSNVKIFEPIKSYCDNIKYRFSNNNKIEVYNFGLSKLSREMEIFCLGDGTSAYRTSEGKENVEMVDVVEFLNNNNILKIDLMKLNIEGGEYDVLFRLIECDRIQSIRYIQVQFHDFIPNCVAMRKAIQDELSKTHHLTYNFDFIWESWELNPRT